MDSKLKSTMEGGASMDEEKEMPNGTQSGNESATDQEQETLEKASGAVAEDAHEETAGEEAAGQ